MRMTTYDNFLPKMTTMTTMTTYKLIAWNYLFFSMTTFEKIGKNEGNRECLYIPPLKPPL